MNHARNRDRIVAHLEGFIVVAVETLHAKGGREVSFGAFGEI